MFANAAILQRGSKSAARTRAFTLIELIVVMAIIVALMGLMLPAFNGIKGGSDLTKAAYDIAGLLEQARTYAMAQHTYVFVGIVEVDAAGSESANPQLPASASAGGRVAAMAFASKDGTRGYSLVDPSASWSDGYAKADDGSSQIPGYRLVALTKLQRFENLHLATLLPNPPDGPMHRETVSATGSFSYVMGDNLCTSVTPIAYPLGTALGSGQYAFARVIYFDPQGVARIQGASNTDEISNYIEIDLQPSHGNALPALPSANLGLQAALQIDCMTGSVRIYKP